MTWEAMALMLSMTADLLILCAEYLDGFLDFGQVNYSGPVLVCPRYRPYCAT
jgi:hypothetical protein